MMGQVDTTAPVDPAAGAAPERSLPIVQLDPGESDGSGEAAELAYLSLKESGLEPVAVFDHEGQRGFERSGEVSRRGQPREHRQSDR